MTSIETGHDGLPPAKARRGWRSRRVSWRNQWDVFPATARLSWWKHRWRARCFKHRRHVLLFYNDNYPNMIEQAWEECDRCGAFVRHRDDLRTTAVSVENRRPAYTAQ